MSDEHDARFGSLMDAYRHGYSDGQDELTDELRELLSDTWDYRRTLKERRQEAMDDEDTEAAAYISGKMSSLVHMTDSIEALIDD